MNPIITFVIYEEMKNMIFEDEFSFPPLFTIFFISMVSKAAATIVTYPMITFRTKAYTCNKVMPLKQRFDEFVKKEGYDAFYRGIVTKMLKTIISNAITMIIFEKSRYYLNVEAAK